MKAWQFTGTNQPLALNEVPEPGAGPGQVVIDIKAAGLCHSDVGVLDDPGWMPLIAKLPITIGHENAGVIAELGEGVTGFKVGDRVAVCPTTPAGAPGYSFDGGFAPKMVIDAQALVPIPDEVDFLAGAAATDAGMTSYAAVISQGGVKRGDKVGIIGFGGLGQIGARVAVLKGAEVYVAELNEAVWPLALEAGMAGVSKSLTDFPGVKSDVIDHQHALAHPQPVQPQGLQRRHQGRHRRRLPAHGFRRPQAHHHGDQLRRDSRRHRQAARR